MESIFDRLPLEMLLKICSYLNTYDLLQFCETCSAHARLLQNKLFTRNINLCKEYRMNFLLHRDLVPKINPRHVISLNINGVYWVPLDDLRKCITALRNLECLYLLDTQFYVSERNSACLSSLRKVSKCVQVKLQSTGISETVRDTKSVKWDEWDDTPIKLWKLAVCIHADQLTIKAADSFPPVKSLMLHVSGSKPNVNIAFVNILINKSAPEELWYIDKYVESSALPDPSIIKSLKKFIAYRVGDGNFATKIDKYVSPDIPFVYADKRRGFYQLERGCGSSKVDIKKFEPCFATAWKLWTNLGFVPFSPEDLKALAKNASDCGVSELNFDHDYKAPIPCEAERCGLLYCLKSGLTWKLKKLSFPYCLTKELYERPTGSDSEVYNSDGDGCCYKRRRRSSKEQLSRAAFQRHEEDNPTTDIYLTTIGWRFYNLTELEIWQSCEEGCTAEDHDFDYASIGRLGLLRKLSLAVLDETPTGFIKDVFQNCVHLEVLRIICESNDDFFHKLCDSLPLAKNLRDFRYQTCILNLDKAFDHLCAVNIPSILRILLKTVYTKSFKSVLKIKGFLEKNRQLILFCIVAMAADDTLIEALNCVFQNFKTDKKVMAAFKTSDNVKDYLPEVHNCEMYESRSNVAVYDIYNDFIV